MSETWGRKTDAELADALDTFAVAQEHLAANCDEDRTHWHHVACAHLYAEAATRLRKAWADLHDEKMEHSLLQELLSRPEIDDFLDGIVTEAAHQRQRWGDAHDRSKSAENWFWLVGYLGGKALRAAIEGNKSKAKHHTISAAAALFQWHQAINADETDCGIGADADIRDITEKLGGE